MDSTRPLRNEHTAMREGFTPAALLLHVLLDNQAYPLHVRQGAAWGLHRICSIGALEPEDRERVSRALHAHRQDLEFDESKIRELIAAVLPEPDDRIRQLLAATERYAREKDGDELTEAVNRVVSFPDLAEQIRAEIDRSPQSNSRADFGERMIRADSPLAP